MVAPSPPSRRRNYGVTSAMPSRAWASSPTCRWDGTSPPSPGSYGWDADRIEKRVAELLELVGLDPAVYAEKRPSELSGGEAQRVGVARSLAADPPVLLMDEPFGALDPISRERLQREFADLHRRLGKTVVFVTHDIEEAVILGDRIVLMRDGRIIQVGRAGGVVAHSRPAVRP